jgi:hypothetical protein
MNFRKNEAKHSTVFKMPYPFAQIRIYSEHPIEAVAAELSDKIFSGLAFCDKEFGLFDEVPAMRLRGCPLGLFIAIHGQEGEYVLVIQPTPKAMREQDMPHADISDYVAGLARSIADWRIEIPKT